MEKIDKKNKSIILNCGYGKGNSVKQVVKEFIKYSNNNFRIIHRPRRKGDLIKIIALTKKLKKFISWKPKYDKLQLMVKSSIRWEKISKNSK